MRFGTIRGLPGLPSVVTGALRNVSRLLGHSLRPRGLALSLLDRLVLLLGAMIDLSLGFSLHAMKLLLEILQFLVAELLQVDQLGARPLHAADQFVELQVNSLGVAVL